MRKRSYSLLLASMLLLMACGSEPQEGYAQLDTSLADQFSEAVWYAELGEDLSFASRGDGVRAEDGAFHANSIWLTTPQDGSTYINGVFYVDVPDEESAVFYSSVGFPESMAGDEAVSFQLLVQEEDQFPSLARIEGAADGHLDELQADLSAYRGRSVVLILASSWESSTAPSDLLWVNPTISNSLR